MSGIAMRPMERSAGRGSGRIGRAAGIVAPRALVVAVVLGGCTAWEAAPRARTLAAEILHCDQVEVAQRAENVFHATGCGGEIDVACTEGQNEPHCERVRVRGSAEVLPGERAGEGAGTGAGTGEAEGAGAGSAEAIAELRIVIDAHRDDILACASRDRVVVHVRTDANGAASTTLAGDLAGSPEEGCVRAALGDLRGPPSVEVIHLVR